MKNHKLKNLKILSPVYLFIRFFFKKEDFSESYSVQDSTMKRFHLLIKEWIGSLFPSSSISVKIDKSLASLVFFLLLGAGNAFGQVSTLQDWSNLYHNTSTASQSISYTVPTGTNSNRVLAVAIASSQTAVGSRSVTISYGGQTMSLATGDMGVATIRQHTAIYYLNEVGLDAASNSNLVFTVSGGTTRITDVFAAVFDYVDQTSPITNSQNYNSGALTTSTLVFGTALTINTNDQAVLVASSFRQASTTLRTLTAPTSFTLSTQQTWTTTDAVRNAMFNRALPNASANSTCSTTISGASLGSMTGVSFKACTAATANAGSALSSLCQGGTSAALGGSVGGSATGGTWSSSAGGTFTPNETTLNATWTPPANYSGIATLTLTSNGGSCGIATATKTQEVIALPVVTNVSTCPGGSGMLTVSSVCGDISTNTAAITAGSGATTGTGTAWSNPGNILATGSATVSLTTASNSQILRASNFGFNIPANSTIKGIVVTINKMVNNTTGTRSDVVVQLYNASGTLVGDNKALTSNWPGAFDNVVYGSESDNWNASLTVNDINSANFGVAQSAQCSSGTARVFSVDYIEITVYYSLPGNIEWYTASSGGSPIAIGSSFNPVGVAGSGLINSNTPGTTSYWVQCNSIPGNCRAKADFVINNPTTTTWDGTTSTWSNGEPDANKAAIISGTFNTSGATTPYVLTACKLNVTNNATVLIKAGDSVVLNGPLTVDQGSVVTFNNTANLLQSGTTNANSGAIVVKRDSSPLKRLDYTLWSSPVTGQQLQAFSPNTLSNRFYSYDTSNSIYQVVDATTNFTPLKGYLIRTPNTHSVSTPAIWTGQFVGVPNNGDYSMPLQNFAVGNRYNLIGNPYPSAIDINTFIQTNLDNGSITGTVYLWRKTNGAGNGAYVTCNLGGYTSNGDSGIANMPLNPINNTNVIQVGQGFFVEGTGSGSVVFNNDMRINTSVNRFFRTANTVERNRVWLNITNATGSFSQAMIAYMTGATQGVDPAIDGKLLSDGDVSLASLIGTTSYAIQGRSLPFDMTDVVPLSFKVTTAGDYTITIDHVDGLFSNGAQTVYLRDTTTGIVHDLSAGGYTFTSASGTFDTRFEIIYQAPLAVSTPTFNEGQVVIYKTPTNEISINTGNVVMSMVKIFDITGRLLQEKKGVNATQTLMNTGLSSEILLVQITSEEGVVVTKKVLIPRTSLKLDKNTIIKTQVAEDE